MDKATRLENMRKVFASRPSDAPLIIHWLDIWGMFCYITKKERDDLTLYTLYNKVEQKVELVTKEEPDAIAIISADVNDDLINAFPFIKAVITEVIITGIRSRKAFIVGRQFQASTWKTVRWIAARLQFQNTGTDFRLNLKTATAFPTSTLRRGQAKLDLVAKEMDEPGNNEKTVVLISGVVPDKSSATLSMEWKSNGEIDSLWLHSKKHYFMCFSFVHPADFKGKVVEIGGYCAFSDEAYCLIFDRMLLHAFNMRVEMLRLCFMTEEVARVLIPLCEQYGFQNDIESYLKKIIVTR